MHSLSETREKNIMRCLRISYDEELTALYVAKKILTVYTKKTAYNLFVLCYINTKKFFYSI